GTSGPGTVRFISTDAFLVQGAHEYSTEGSYNATITVRDSYGRTQSINATLNQDRGFLEIDGPHVAVARVGSNLTGFELSASFLDETSGDPASAYQVLIDWNDGGTDNAPISGTNGHFRATAIHSYMHPGNYQATVTVVHGDYRTAAVTLVLPALAVVYVGEDYNPGWLLQPGAMV